MKVDVLLGIQWGDEGKGKIVDVLAPEYDVIARFQGGPNAGHTIKFADKKFILHTIPSGVFYNNKINIIGNGVIIDPFIMSKEIDNLESNNIDVRSQLRISRRAHLILPSHRLMDAVQESAKGKGKIGSTLKGIGPTYTDKTARNGIRIGDLFHDFDSKYNKLKESHFDYIKQFDVKFDEITLDKLSFADYEQEWLKSLDLLRKLQIVDSEYLINDLLERGKRILAEGAQGTMLDVDFGSYPFVTSSNTSIGGVCTGLGVAPLRIGKVMGVFKAYCTRVGSGPFPTELKDGNGELMRRVGSEYGSTTGRPRRCGWLDLAALKYSIMLNGISRLFMMKTDVLNSFENISVGVGYKIEEKETDKIPFDYADSNLVPVYTNLPGWNSDLEDLQVKGILPEKLESYIRFIEDFTKVPVTIVSFGPGRDQTYMRGS